MFVLVSYKTPYRWKMSYKQRFGLVNVVSGRAVMLNDLDRLRDGDNQFAAHLSPRGDAVGYWVYPYDGEPRLSIQYIDAAPLRVKGLSLPDQLARHRKLGEPKQNMF